MGSAASVQQARMFRVHFRCPPSARRRGHSRFGSWLRLAADYPPTMRPEPEHSAVATARIDIGHCEVGWVVLADPDDIEFCVMTPDDEV